MNPPPKHETALLARMSVLDAAIRALAGDLTLDGVLQRIVGVAAGLAGARYGALGVVGADGMQRDFITTGLSPDERKRLGALPRGHGLLGVPIRQEHPLRVSDINHDLRRAGFPAGHPPMTSLLGVPIRARGVVVGDLYLTDKIGSPTFSEDDQRLIELLAAHAGVAIENAYLYAQLAEVTTVRERDRFARDLHDGIIQDIYAGILQRENLAEDLEDATACEQAHGIADHFSRVIGDVRTYIHGLIAHELEGRSLGDGIAILVREVSARSTLPVACGTDGEPYRLPEALANTLLQITREALWNVVQHAGASHAQVHLAYGKQTVTLTIADDGCGFDPAKAVGEEHRGLRNLRSRMQEVGGALRLQRESATTAVIASVPRPD